jgi:ribonuclease HII
MLTQYFEKNKIELGIDEAGRGCLFGPVVIGSVIWLDEDPNPNLEIKDSKKCSLIKRKELREYIEDNSILFNVKFLDNDYIDKYNILESTLNGMHRCVDNIIQNINIDTILVDGNKFHPYFDDNDNHIPHVCIINGDNTYKSIAAASILAKEYRDEYILNLVKENPILEKYDIHNNKGYGTKKHLDAIKKYGLTKWHRKTFGICKKYFIQNQ